MRTLLRGPMTRRDCLDTCAFGAAVSTASASCLGAQFSSPASTPAAPRRPQIRAACCAANFHGFRAGAYSLPAIEVIGELGFDGIELIALAPADLDTIWSGTRFDAIRRALDAAKLVVSRSGSSVPSSRHCSAPYMRAVWGHVYAAQFLHGFLRERAASPMVRS